MVKVKAVVGNKKCVKEKRGVGRNYYKALNHWVAVPRFQGPGNLCKGGLGFLVRNSHEGKKV